MKARSRVADEHFVGEICGFGSTSGVRVVIGRWASSPFGSFADAMVADADDRRVLIAPDRPIADYVSSIYTFDEVVVAPVRCVRATDVLRFDGGPLGAEVHVGARRALGWLLRSVPRKVATSPGWAMVTDPIARRVLRGVRTRAASAGGEEFYGATDCRRLASAAGHWHGRDLGDLADVDPPVRFGLGSTPRRPSIVELTTTVRQP